MHTPLSVGQPQQQDFLVRCDWAQEGLRSISPGAGVIVVIDAISFTTTVERAVTAGLEVQPFSGKRSEAERLAATGAFGTARLAGRRGDAGISLASVSMTVENVAAFGTRRAVITSFNGSRLSAAAIDWPVPVVAASLRNRRAAAQWIIEYQRVRGERAAVAVVAAGELRDDDSVRFAVEDHIVAGAVIEALAQLGQGDLSPEAKAARASFASLTDPVIDAFSTTTSGAELIRAGQGDDIRLAAEVDVSTAVPVLIDGAYRCARPQELATRR